MLRESFPKESVTCGYVFRVLSLEDMVLVKILYTGDYLYGGMGSLRRRSVFYIRNMC